LKLVAASANSSDGSMPRQPFSLTFSGPPDRILAQGTFRFTHSELGALEIFVVPVGRDENGATYEAVFA
jgi:hypothetical protein